MSTYLLFGHSHSTVELIEELPFGCQLEDGENERFRLVEIVQFDDSRMVGQYSENLRL